MSSGNNNARNMSRSMKRKYTGNLENVEEKKGANLFMESRGLLTDIITPRRQSTYVPPNEINQELTDFDEVLFQSRKNTPSVFSEKPLPYELPQDDFEEPSNLTDTVIRFIRARAQFFAILISVLLGLLIGALMRLRKEEYSKLELFIIRFPGLFYMRMLSSMLTPLIAASTISSLGRLNFKLGFELFWRFTLHAAITKMIVITLAMVVTLIMVPGRGLKVAKGSHGEIVTSNFLVALTDFFRHAFPDSLIGMFYKTDRTFVVYKGPTLPDDIKLQQTLLSNSDNWMYAVRPLYFPNYIGLVMCSWGIGFALQRIIRENRLILRLTISVENILLKLGDWFLRFAAIGKFSLLIAAIVSYDVSGGTHTLFPYGATIFTTCFLYIFIISPIYFYFMTFVNPWPYFKKMLPVLFTAFTTSSSVVTLPSTLSYLEEDANLGNVPCRLMAPFGAVVNMDGAAVYQSVTPIFLAQVFNHELTLWHLCTIWLNSFLESINISPVPHDSHVTGITTALMTVDISLDQYDGLVRKLHSIDGVVDRFRTLLNVFGDIVTALIVHLVMVRSAEKRVGFMSIRSFLEKQDQKRRAAWARKEKSNKVIAEQNVIEQPVIKSDDLELVSISSTTSEDKIN